MTRERRNKRSMNGKILLKSLHILYTSIVRSFSSLHWDHNETEFSFESPLTRKRLRKKKIKKNRCLNLFFGSFPWNISRKEIDWIVHIRSFVRISTIRIYIWKAWSRVESSRSKFFSRSSSPSYLIQWEFLFFFFFATILVVLACEAIHFTRSSRIAKYFNYLFHSS